MSNSPRLHAKVTALAAIDVNCGLQLTIKGSSFLRLESNAYSALLLSSFLPPKQTVCILFRCNSLSLHLNK